jgi:NDP-sugar pyrophosphorylase family protein
LGDVDEPFLVMNGDILTDLNFASFCKSHQSGNAIATVAMYNKKIKIELGTLECNKDMDIIDYIEKPTLEYNVSTGIYMFSPRVKGYLEYNQRLDLPDLIRKLIDNCESVRGYPLEGLWFDLGRKEDYEEINEKYSGEIETMFMGGQSALSSE